MYSNAGIRTFFLFGDDSVCFCLCTRSQNRFRFLPRAANSFGKVTTQSESSPVLILKDAPRIDISIFPQFTNRHTLCGHLLSLSDLIGFIHHCVVPRLVHHSQNTKTNEVPGVHVIILIFPHLTVCFAFLLLFYRRRKGCRRSPRRKSRRYD